VRNERNGMKKTNLAFAVFAYLCFAGFLGLLAWFVPRLDLVVVISIVLALALYDLWTELGARRR
jgi:hypothetical protein